MKETDRAKELDGIIDNCVDESLKPHNKAENEIVKKRLFKINNLICDLLEQWDKWHLQNIANLLKEKTKDIERLLNDAYELQDPDSDVLRLIYCLGHTKIVIQKYVKDGITREKLIESFRKPK